MLEEEMIKRFINNLKHPYYEKMISAQVTHFENLIPIGEHIDEGIRSKKIADPDTLYSPIEQKVKKASTRKGKEVDVHMLARTLDRLRASTSTYATLVVQSFPPHAQPAHAPNRTRGVGQSTLIS